MKIDIKFMKQEQSLSEPYVCPYNYSFPGTIQECYEFSLNWHLPLVLSIFKDLKSILKLMTAILLERSMIFVSEHQARLSSAMLGLKAMIKPFGWCHRLIPILPGALLDYIECPCPILCGITY